ncbi:calcium-activated potassium channel subunit beta-3 [Parambassis ranga]|uniref:Calcium-activated potassium channel subunit beta-3 n=1 Tax=Parambassis ranga TaxID=210632 RepID=A0A6P7K1Z9_9TELE|nr:calcium-activated potassium channel subunit beta-3-like [Parambassis ranga]
MFLNAASSRRSFSIPININLHGARRRQTRELLNTTVVQEHECCRGADSREGQGAWTQMPVSSVGEDRAILLGFTMMAFSVLMFFVVGITVVKPYINSNWEGQVDCVLRQTDIPEEWVDCRGVSTVPCLRVMVNLTASNQEAFLHFDEETVLLGTECFYIPKCQMDRKALQDEVKKLKSSLDSHLGSTSCCLSDTNRHPSHVILNKKYTLRKILLALLWPCLMLGGGALLVGLVKLTQCLANLSSEVCNETTKGRLPSRYTQYKLYRLLRRSSMQFPS